MIETIFFEIRKGFTASPMQALVGHDCLLILAIKVRGEMFVLHLQ